MAGSERRCTQPIKTVRRSKSLAFTNRSSKYADDLVFHVENQTLFNVFTTIRRLFSDFLRFLGLNSHGGSSYAACEKSCWTDRKKTSVAFLAKIPKNPDFYRTRKQEEESETGQVTGK